MWSVSLRDGRFELEDGPSCDQEVGLEVGLSGPMVGILSSFGGWLLQSLLWTVGARGAVAAGAPAMVGPPPAQPGRVPPWSPVQAVRSCQKVASDALRLHPLHWKALLSDPFAEVAAFDGGSPSTTEPFGRSDAEDEPLTKLRRCFKGGCPLEGEDVGAPETTVRGGARGVASWADQEDTDEPGLDTDDAQHSNRGGVAARCGRLHGEQRHQGAGGPAKKCRGRRKATEGEDGAGKEEGGGEGGGPPARAVCTRKRQRPHQRSTASILQFADRRESRKWAVKWRAEEDAVLEGNTPMGAALQGPVLEPGRGPSSPSSTGPCDGSGDDPTCGSRGEGGNGAGASRQMDLRGGGGGGGAAATERRRQERQEEHRQLERQLLSGLQALLAGIAAHAVEPAAVRPPSRAASTGGRRRSASRAPGASGQAEPAATGAPGSGQARGRSPPRTTRPPSVAAGRPAPPVAMEEQGLLALLVGLVRRYQQGSQSGVPLLQALKALVQTATARLEEEEAAGRPRSAPRARWADQEVGNEPAEEDSAQGQWQTAAGKRKGKAGPTVEEEPTWADRARASTRGPTLGGQGATQGHVPAQKVADQC